jgi:hypothetical protein
MMQTTNTLTRVLAISGSVLVWLTLLSPFLLWLLFSAWRGSFSSRHFDYLMPAELFPVALAGGLLLFGAALRARRYRLWVVVSLGLAVLLLVGLQGVAVASGLATGEIGQDSWQWGLVQAMLGVFWLALAGLGVGGVLLGRQPGKKL